MTETGIRTPAALWHAVGRQLRCPSGFAGSVAGWLMTAVNATPNRLAVDALDPSAGERILELGFGPGHGVARIAATNPDAQIYGLDQSAVMVRQATRRNRWAIANGQMALRQGSFVRLPWDDGFFDKILLVNTVYFFDGGRDVAEVRRVLRPGGRLIVYATARSAMERWPFAASHRLFDEDQLRCFLRQAAGGYAEVCIDRIRLPLGLTGYLGRATKALS